MHDGHFQSRFGYIFSQVYVHDSTSVLYAVYLIELSLLLTTSLLSPPGKVQRGLFRMEQLKLSTRLPISAFDVTGTRRKLGEPVTCLWIFCVVIYLHNDLQAMVLRKLRWQRRSALMYTTISRVCPRLRALQSIPLVPTYGVHRASRQGKRARLWCKRSACLSHATFLLTERRFLPPTH